MEKKTFDPNKAYKWGPTDEFKLTGSEFGLLLNSMRAVLGTEEAQRILLVNEGNKVVENILARAVEDGIAEETEQKDNSSL